MALQIGANMVSKLRPWQEEQQEMKGLMGNAVQCSGQLVTWDQKPLLTLQSLTNRHPFTFFKLPFPHSLRFSKILDYLVSTGSPGSPDSLVLPVSLNLKGPLGLVVSSITSFLIS